MAGDVSKSMRRATRSNSLLTAFQLASLSAAKSQSNDLTSRQVRAGGNMDISIEKRETAEELESNEDDKLLLNVDVDRSAAKRDNNDVEDSQKVSGLEDAAFEESKFYMGQHELGKFERDDTNVEDTERSAEQWRNQKEQVALGVEEAAQKREDVIDDTHSKKERAEDELEGSKKSSRKSDKKDAKTGQAHSAHWFAHPGTIALLVAVAVLLCCCCVYCLTPIKGKVDDMMRGGNGGFMSTFSRNKSSHNASQNATPSDVDGTVRDRLIDRITQVDYYLCVINVC